MNEEKLAIPSISEALSTFSRVDAATNPASLVDFLDQAAAAYFAQIERAVRRVADLKLASPERCREFIRVLDETTARGEFFCIATVMLVSALKPA